MTIYRRMNLRSWEEGVFPRLSPLVASGQALALALALGPASTIIPGCANAGRGTLSDLLGWSTKDLDRCLAELQQRGALIDLRARLIVLPWILREAVAESPNVAKAWRRRFDELPDCEPKREIDVCVRRLLTDISSESAAKGDVVTKDGKKADPWAWIKAWDPSFDPSGLGPRTPTAIMSEDFGQPPVSHPREVAAPFAESVTGMGSSEQETASGQQGSGDRPQAPENGSQAARTRKGKSGEKGKPERGRLSLPVHECSCGILIRVDADGNRANAHDGSPHVHDQSAEARSDR